MTTSLEQEYQAVSTWVPCPLCTEEWNRLDPRHNFCIKCTETVKGMRQISSMYPPKPPFDNWGKPLVEIEPSPGKKPFEMYRCKDFEERVIFWENYQARVQWGGSDCKIQKDGQMFRIDLGDGDPVFASTALIAWNLYKKLILERMDKKEEKPKSFRKF